MKWQKGASKVYLIPMIGILLMLIAAIVLILPGCERGTSSVGPIFLIQPDSIRYVQAEKDQPYALLWPSNNTVNLWMRVDEKQQEPSYPYLRTCRARFSVVMASRGSGDVYDGSMVSAWTDSCVVDSATFHLTMSGDTLMTGWLSMRWTGTCGGSRVTIPLALARQ